MIEEKKLQEIIQKIVTAVSPQKIILFGSYATGNATYESDLDLVVIWDTKMNTHERNMKIRRLFPRRDFSLDVFVFTPEEESKYRDIKGTILNMSLMQGKVVYERK